MTLLSYTPPTTCSSAVFANAAGPPPTLAMADSIPASRTVGLVLSPGAGMIVRVPEEKGLAPLGSCAITACTGARVGLEAREC